MESNLNTILPVLDSLGVDYKQDGNRAKMLCPFHDEKTPSFVVFDNNGCFCFGCQKYCWHDELIAKLADCSIVEAKKKLGTYDPDVQYEPSDKSPTKKARNYGFAEEPGDYTNSWDKLQDEMPPEMVKFLDSKGLTEAAYNLGLWRWCPKGTFKCWNNREGICIPYFSSEGNIVTYRLRQYDRMRDKFGHPIAPKGIPLQASFLFYNKNEPVYFCEGESDSLSLHSLGYNVICLPGVGAHKQINSAIRTCMDWGVPEFVFCGDNDSAGQGMNEYCKEATYDLGMGIFTPKIRVLKLPQEYNLGKDGTFKRKDINDFFVEGRLQDILSGKRKEPTWLQKTPTNLLDLIPGAEEISQDELKGVF